MSKRRSVAMLCVIALTWSALAACAPESAGVDSALETNAPAAETEAGASEDTAQASDEVSTEAASAEGSSAEGAGSEDSSEGGAAGESADSSEGGGSDEGAATVDAEATDGQEGTVQDDTLTTQQPEDAPGQSEPGPAEGDGQDSAPGGAAGQTVDSGATVYLNSAYGFSVAYPADYVLGEAPAEKLEPLEPRPVAAYTLMNPDTATSDIADLEPADLEIRIYPSAGATSLEAWLGANGFTGDGNSPAEPYQNTNVTGAEICASTMLGPGCSVFVLGGEWVYQMVPATIQGESIMNSFALVP